MHTCVSLRYPTAGLDLTPWVHPTAARLTGRPCVYDLTSVVCHSGSSSASGHYTCLGKDLSAAVGMPLPATH